MTGQTQGTEEKGQNSLVEAFQASTPEEKARWVQTALAFTPYNANDTKKIKEKKLDLLRGVAEVSSKDAGGALKQAQEYVGDQNPVVRRSALFVAEVVAQHSEHAGAALVFANHLKNDPDSLVRECVLLIAEVAARHPEHAGDALALVQECADKDQNEDVRDLAQFIAQSIFEGGKPKPEGATPTAAAGAAPAP